MEVEHTPHSLAWHIAGILSLLGFFPRPDEYSSRQEEDSHGVAAWNGGNDFALKVRNDFSGVLITKSRTRNLTYDDLKRLLEAKNRDEIVRILGLKNSKLDDSRKFFYAD